MESGTPRPSRAARALPRPRRAAAPAGRLTPREWEIVGLIADGKSPKQIAAELGSRPQTVYNQLHQLHLKLGVNDRVGVLLALRLIGPVTPPRPAGHMPRRAAW